MVPVPFIGSLFARWLKQQDQKSFGRFAESLAAWYLRLKGYQILSRNWRTRWGEIDLIVQKGKTLVFVEVKARRSTKRGSPEEALTPQKQVKLLKLARLYLASHPLSSAKEIRFDLVAIDFSPQKPHIKHYKGAIYDE